MDDSTNAAAATTVPDRLRRRLWLLLAGTTALVLIADQITKYLVVEHLRAGEPVTVISGWLEFTLVRNPGAAFNMATGTTWIFTVIAFLVSFVIIRVSRRLGSRGWALALGLLLGGALGNLLDRLFRDPGFARGHVVDFIHYLKFPFMDFPVFNVADSCIVTSACLIALLGFRNIGLDGSRHPGGSSPSESRASDTPAAETPASETRATDG